jgi:hypothetical protein
MTIPHTPAVRAASELAARVLALPLPDRLRLAALLVERDEIDLAQPIVEQVSDELWVRAKHAAAPPRVTA